jgi:hypothetical protein
MACGKPVVTTRHVEIPRIVEQVLVDENDVDGLADALRTVYASAKLREELGRRSRELAEKHFTPGNLAQTMTLLKGIALSTDATVPDKKLNGSGALSLGTDHRINGYANANGGATGKTELEPVRTPIRRAVANQPTGVSS